MNLLCGLSVCISEHALPLLVMLFELSGLRVLLRLRTLANWLANRLRRRLMLLLPFLLPLLLMVPVPVPVPVLLFGFNLDLLVQSHLIELPGVVGHPCGAQMGRESGGAERARSLAQALGKLQKKKYDNEPLTSCNEGKTDPGCAALDGAHPPGVFLAGGQQRPHVEHAVRAGLGVVGVEVAAGGGVSAVLVLSGAQKVAQGAGVGVSAAAGVLAVRHGGS